MTGRSDDSTIQSSVLACARRTGAAARESLWRDRPGRLTSPALHSCEATILFAHDIVTVAKNKSLYHL